MTFQQNIIPIIILLLSSINQVLADDITDKFVDAQSIFEQALIGDESKTEIAQQKFKALLKQTPNHPLFNAYYGSSFTLMARDAWMPWTQVSFAEKGLAIIDKALVTLDKNQSNKLFRDTPASVETRLVAISTFLKVPGFMHRLEQAKQELDNLFNDEAYALTPAIVKSRIYYQAALIAQREDNLRLESDHLKKAISYESENRFADMAKNRLKEIEYDLAHNETDE